MIIFLCVFWYLNLASFYRSIVYVTCQESGRPTNLWLWVCSWSVLPSRPVFRILFLQTHKHSYSLIANINFNFWMRCYVMVLCYFLKSYNLYNCRSTMPEFDNSFLVVCLLRTLFDMIYLTVYVVPHIRNFSFIKTLSQTISAIYA